MLDSLRNLAPIILVIAFFQIFVLQQPPDNVASLLTGTLFVVLGLTFFIYGLEMGLFPIGESMAHAFARKGSIFWLLTFAFALGFGTTVAEPALIAISEEASEVAAKGGSYCSHERGHGVIRNGPALYRCTLGRCCDRDRRAQNPDELVDSLHDYDRLYHRGYCDCVCTRRNNRYCLRFRRGDDIDDHGAAGDRIGDRARIFDQRTQPDD